MKYRYFHLIWLASAIWTCSAFGISADSLNMQDIHAKLDVLEAEAAIIESQVDALKQDSSLNALYMRAELDMHLATLQARLNELNRRLNGSSETAEEVLVSRGNVSMLPASQVEPLTLATPIQLEEESGIEISGFMDAIYEATGSENQDQPAYLNQVEVDLAKPLGNRAEAVLGIIYAESFQVGTALISYDLVPQRESARLLYGATVAAGQFDAPFGEDVNAYPSNLRSTVSIPEINAATLNLWNDVGVSSSWGFPSTTVDIWAMRGFALQSNPENEEPLAEVHVAGGVRLNHEVTDALRVGGSVANGWLPDGSSAMNLTGAHLVYSRWQWSITTEYMHLNEDLAGLSLNREGYYAQAVRQLGRFYAFGRIDRVNLGDGDFTKLGSLGAGAELTQGLSLRLEQQATWKLKEPKLFVQIVASF